MPQTLCYGVDCRFEIDLPADALLADCSAPQLEPVDDPAAAMAAALAQPLDFPPLARATVEGDRVALLLDPGLPQAATLVAGVVHYLIDSGTKPEDITLVRTSGHELDDSLDLKQHLPEELRAEIDVVLHQAGDSESLAYLATTKGGSPLYVHRSICDADVVIPIGLFRLDPQHGEPSVHAGVLSMLAEVADTESDTPTRDKTPLAHDEADEAAWLLGIHFVVQVIPGRGDSVLHILAGEANHVLSRGRKLCEMAWRFPVARRASLVVATIEGDERQQSWSNFGRALLVASQAVSEDGAIVICSDLKAPLPAPRADSLPGSNPLKTLKQVARRSRVYLLSSIDSAVVEDLGMAHIESTDEITRLSRQHESCILVSCAQHAVVATEDG